MVKSFGQRCETGKNCDITYNNIKQIDKKRKRCGKIKKNHPRRQLASTEILLKNMVGTVK